MIASGSRDKASLCPVGVGQDSVHRTPDLEGAGKLKVLELQHQNRIYPERAPLKLDNGGAADLRRDKFGCGVDARG